MEKAKTGKKCARRLHYYLAQPPLILLIFLAAPSPPLLFAGEENGYTAEISAGDADDAPLQLLNLEATFRRWQRMGIFVQGQEGFIDKEAFHKIGFGLVAPLRKSGFLALVHGYKRLADLEAFTTEFQGQWFAEDFFTVAFMLLYEDNQFGDNLLVASLQFRLYITPNLMVQTGLKSDRLRETRNAQDVNLRSGFAWQPTRLQRTGYQAGFFLENWAVDVINAGIRLHWPKGTVTLRTQHRAGALHLLR